MTTKIKSKTKEEPAGGPQAFAQAAECLKTLRALSDSGWCKCCCMAGTRWGNSRKIADIQTTWRRSICD